MRLAAVGTLALTLLALAGCGGSGSRPLTREEYLARVDAICREYGRKLSSVPPPSSFDDLPAVARSVARALPLLERQADKARTVEPPPGLARLVHRFFYDSDGSIRALRLLRDSAAKRARSTSKRALLAFFEAREEARRTADRLGITC